MSARDLDTIEKIREALRRGAASREADAKREHFFVHRHATGREVKLLRGLLARIPDAPTPPGRVDLDAIERDLARLDPPREDYVMRLESLADRADALLAELRHLRAVEAAARSLSERFERASVRNEGRGIAPETWAEALALSRVLGPAPSDAPEVPPLAPLMLPTNGELAMRLRGKFAGANDASNEQAWPRLHIDERERWERIADGVIEIARETGADPVRRGRAIIGFRAPETGCAS